MTTSPRAESRVSPLIKPAVLAVWALLVRLLALLHPARIVWGDEPFYLWLGRNWMTGRGYDFMGFLDVHHTPMYPLITGLAYLVTRNLELASDISYVFFGALLIVPIYLIGKELYNADAGAMSAALLAVYPAVSTAPLLWGTLTEPPYYFFVYTGLLMVLLALRRDRLWYYALGGLFFGLAYLTRPEAVAYLAIGGAVIGLIRLLQKRLSTRFLLRLGVYVLAFLICFVPYGYYVYTQTGSWMISEKAGVTFVTCLGLSEGNTRSFDEATWGLDSTGKEVFFFSRESFHVSMVDVILTHPSEFVALVLRNARRFVASLLSSRLFPYYFLALIGLGLFKASWDKKRAEGELLLLASLSPVAVFILFFIQDRYIATVLPTLVIWLGLGAYELGSWLQGTVANLLSGRSLGRFARTALLWIPTLLLILFFVAMQPRVISLYANVGSYRLEHKALGLWMRENLPAESVVMTRYPAIAFYADARWEPAPNADYEAMLRYAEANDVDYFVLDEGETLELRPQYACLLQENQEIRGLEVVHTVDSSGGRLVVFKLQ